MSEKDRKWDENLKWDELMSLEHCSNRIEDTTHYLVHSSTELKTE